MDASKFEEKTIRREEVFTGQLIQLVVDQVLLPDGQTSTRELVFHPGAVGIIPITKENKLLMVKQFRKPLEKVILEIPAGKIDPGEKDIPIETAKRELEEETGYQAQHFTFVTSMYVSPGFANEILHVYLAEELEKVPHPLAQDADEFLELYELTLDEAKQAIASGLICDAKTIFAVQYWELKQMKQLLEEDTQ